MSHYKQPISSNGLRVVLNYGPLGFVQAVTEYITRDQIRVNTGSVTLNHNSEVEIVLSVPGEQYSEHHRIAAQVLHSDEYGQTTLGFRCCGEKTMTALLPYFSTH